MLSTSVLSTSVLSTSVLSTQCFSSLFKLALPGTCSDSTTIIIGVCTQA